jgi:hypothetical protein
MNFRAHYLERKAESKYGKREYWRHVTADNVNEATKMAEKFVNKGFILVTVKGYDDGLD